MYLGVNVDLNSLNEIRFRNLTATGADGASSQCSRVLPALKKSVEKFERKNVEMWVRPAALVAGPI